MRNLCLTIEYDGSDFSGFQRQPDRRTVQGELESAFSRLLGEPIKIIGAGRTDAGVHATGQVVNFLTENPLPLAKATGVFNSALPPDLAVKRVAEADLEFNARHWAKSRIYRYLALNRPLRSACLGRFAGWVAEPLALAPMQQALALLVGERDFSAFQAAGSPARSTVRRLLRAECRCLGDRFWLTLEADAFLYRMARIIAAATFLVGSGQKPVEWLAGLVEKGDRKLAPAPAAPQGLCLIKVVY
jgi:tRNA pseudouridine38-40 synthase